MPQPTDSGAWVGWAAGAAVVLTAVGTLIRKIFVTRSELTEFMKTQDAKFLAALASQKADFEKAQVTQKGDFEKALDFHRSELQRINETQSAERLRLHAENRETVGNIFDRMTDLEKTVSRIDGSLSGRFQRLDER